MPLLGVIVVVTGWKKSQLLVFSLKPLREFDNTTLSLKNVAVAHLIFKLNVYKSCFTEHNESLF
jgi:hypothetical protein